VDEKLHLRRKPFFGWVGGGGGCEALRIMFV
jgi:hypothetical protein